MVTISLCMIVRNEEEVLARCLESVKNAADEIIIVDTGSSDSTKEIASKYTDKIFDFEWIDDFSAARNFAYEKADMDYQMWLDADDVLPSDSLQKLIALKKSLASDIDIVTMKYITHFDANENPILVSTRERLTRRAKNYKWQEPVHECIPLIGNVFNSDIVIHHRQVYQETRSDRNINIYTALEASGKQLSPRQQYYFARELKDHGHWAKAVYYFEKFIYSEKGWVEDNIASCFNLAACYNALGDTSKILPVLFQSFNYDAPRAEILCEIGYYYKRLKDYKTALKWFRIAAGLGETDSLGFVLQSYHGYIPNIESCVCCSEMGDYESAKIYNEKAAEYKPDSEAVSINRRFLLTK